MWAHMGWVMVDQGEEIVENVEDYKLTLFSLGKIATSSSLDSWLESSYLVQSVILHLAEPMGFLAV